MTKIAIIGTAGRKEDGDKLNYDTYSKMYQKALDVISEYENVHLVSGGAAWADHIAVSLYLASATPSLTLYFPFLWNQKSCIFYDNENANTANYYHQLFSRKVNKYTLFGIQKAIDKGAEFFEITDGFKARNLLVGKVDVLIAFTFGQGDVPKAGGTLHAWNNSSAKKKLHFNIGKL